MGIKHVLLLQTFHLHWTAVETALHGFPDVRLTVERPQIAEIVGLCERQKPDLIIAAGTIDQISTLPALAEVRRRRRTNVRFVVIDWSLDDHNRFRAILSLDPVGYFIWRELDALSLPTYLSTIIHHRATTLGPGATLLLENAPFGRLFVSDESPELLERERAVLRLLAIGLLHKEIAQELSVSYETVQRDVRLLREAFDAKTDAELTCKATYLGLIP